LASNFVGDDEPELRLLEPSFGGEGRGVGGVAEEGLCVFSCPVDSAVVEVCCWDPDSIVTSYIKLEKWQVHVSERKGLLLSVHFLSDFEQRFQA
jgi:hypothetical protein